MLAVSLSAVLIGAALARALGRHLAVAWFTGTLCVALLLARLHGVWTVRHPGGHLSTFLNVHHVQASWLLLPVAAVAAVSGVALWLLSGFRIPRRIGGWTVRAATTMGVPLLCFGPLLGSTDLGEWLLRLGSGLVALRVSLGLWQAGVSGGRLWQAAARPALNQRVWSTALLLTGFGCGLLLLSGLMARWGELVQLPW